MGSFAMSCCVSGLPIEYGDRVRFLLLTKMREPDRSVCYMDEIYAPRTWPIQAVYNDYGSIENWIEDDLQKLIVKGFQEDLVEIGVGDNSIHDVAVSKNMNFDQMLDALGEKRIKVRRPGSRMHARVGMSTNEFLPTHISVNDCLQQSVLKDKNCYIADDKIDLGCVRVRWNGSYSNNQDILCRLNDAKEVLSDKFAVVITAGSGPYAAFAELCCFMLPGTDARGIARCYVPDGIEEKDDTHEITFGIIREDVWTGIVSLRKEAAPDIRVFVDEAKKLIQSGDNERILRYSLRSLIRETQGLGVMFGSDFGSHKGLYEHAMMLIREDKLNEEFMKLIVDFDFICDVLQETRYVWRPSYVAGPQFGEYRAHSQLFEVFNKVAKKAIKKKY